MIMHHTDLQKSEILAKVLSFTNFYKMDFFISGIGVSLHIYKQVLTDHIYYLESVSVSICNRTTCCPIWK